MNELNSTITVPELSILTLFWDLFRETWTSFVKHEIDGAKFSTSVNQNIALPDLQHRQI